jgi:hypothetical protein
MEKHEGLVRWNELQAALPFDEAMPDLLPASPKPAAILALAERVGVALASPALQAAVWLYVDDLERSHTISQTISGPVGAVLHGIMHRREGDFWNSKHWLKQARGKPLYDALGHDVMTFVDSVASVQGRNAPELVEEQRLEWQALFDWCLKEAGIA